MFVLLRRPDEQDYAYDNHNFVLGVFDTFEKADAEVERLLETLGLRTDLVFSWKIKKPFYIGTITNRGITHEELFSIIECDVNEFIELNWKENIIF